MKETDVEGLTGRIQFNENGDPLVTAIRFFDQLLHPLEHVIGFFRSVLDDRRLCRLVDLMSV